MTPTVGVALEADRCDAGAIECMDRLRDGERVGRFVVLHDLEGRTHALAAGAVSAVCETDDGSLLILPGGRMLHVPTPLRDVLRWLTCERP